jgi:ABC-type transport system involved in cytochrome c biogenesis permease subunit
MWIALVGYVCVLLNFTVVNLLFTGLHSYSGLK